MTRREFLKGSVYGAIALALPVGKAKPLKMAVITDLHHGLAPDATMRLEKFVEEVHKRKGLDLVLQMGDFCYSQPESAGFAKLFNDLPHRKLHVLGNHDMDKCDKDFAMKFWGMKSRYGAYDVGAYRFVILDLNHFRKEGKLYSYANGNYFTDNAVCNYADPEQLEWLGKELRQSKKPVILISHQPLGFRDPGPELPVEQAEILKVITDAAKENPKGAVAICMFGHNHVDRLEHHEGIPCLCVNSASYFWSSGMWAYSKPLYAFMEITADGHLLIEGVAGEFLKTPPANSNQVVGRSASISDRDIAIKEQSSFAALAM